MNKICKALRLQAKKMETIEKNIFAIFDDMEKRYPDNNYDLQDLAVLQHLALHLQRELSNIADYIAERNELDD